MDELQNIYREIHQKLVAPFPEGTIEYRENAPDSKYIPVQSYIHRLETAAGTYWSWRLTGHQIFEKDKQVMVTGVLKIVEAEREGIGFSKYDIYEDTGKIKNLKYAITAAASDALRNACDLFEMGWRDLAPYRKWAKNPGTGLGTVNLNSHSGHRVCVVCNQPISMEDEEHLSKLNIKHPYHVRHIPQHLIRNKKGDDNI